MRFAKLILALCLIGCSAISSGSVADAKVSPAARVFQAWLAAFNSADAEKFKTFDTTYQAPDALQMAKMGEFRSGTGGFTLVRIEADEGRKLSALVKEKNSDNIARMEMTVSADEPPKLVGVGLRLIPPPGNLAPTRLREADALAALTARMDAAARDDKFSGVVLVAKNGKAVFEKAWGLADREKNTPITQDTQFRMGSMNKMFTAIATLQLIDADKLSLDDLIGKHLTDYPNKDIATKVTLRHLLTHGGGTGDIFGPEFDTQRLTLKTHADYVKLFGARAPNSPPGEKYEYSNYGFVLLGAVIEKVTGMSYYDVVEKNILAPTAMRATASLPESESVANRAVGYMQHDGKWAANTDTLPWRGTAAGGGYSTAGDMLRFANALEAGKLVSKTLLAEATRGQRANYGFGFIVGGTGKWKSYGHGGGAPGMNGELRIYPDQGYVVVVFANRDPRIATNAADFIGARLPGV